ncbi:MAG: MMPL family transporter, partial [Actinobacteria bacterium]|nr:MMPL family transporter [Actinomycetota bacterium]
QAIVLGRIEGDQNEIKEHIEVISPEFTRSTDAVDVSVGGFAEIYRQMQHNIESDLIKAETIAFPITLLLLIIVFGSLVAAGLPLAIGGLAIVGAMFLLRIIAGMTEVSIFALNLTTMLGLGLAIDYSLFIVSRYREELANGLEPHDAVRRTVETAGRTVAFSGLTVALSLSALLVFPLAFLRSFAYAGVSVVLVAILGAVVFLPALLAVMGRKVDSLRLWKRRAKPAGAGRWHQIAMGVMKRPIPIATAVIAFLIFLGIPFFGAQWGQADDRALPKTESSHVVSQQLRDNFSSNNANALSVVVEGQPSETEITAFATELSEIDGVAGVGAATGNYAGGGQISEPDQTNALFASDAGTWLSVIPSVEAFSPEGEQLVAEIRAADASFDVQVTGPSAHLADQTDSLFSRLPLAAGIIGITTFILLFLMFGGILVPIKAIILNMLSLTATFGAMVWIFQEGHLSGALDFTPTGTMELTMPILMFCMAFGLSMDYEVFLLSRIKEEHDLTGDNTASVAIGLERTGGIVTAAAVLLSVVFVAFATSGVTFIKMMGVGLTLAVIMDATLVRATLVPAFMKLAGEANWWAPKWMRKVYVRFGISEGGASTQAPVPVAAER